MEGELGFPDRRRRTPCQSLDTGTAAAGEWRAPESPPCPALARQAFAHLFAASREQQRCLTLFVFGNAIAGVVTRAEGETVELRNRLFERVVVRVDRIEAVSSL